MAAGKAGNGFHHTRKGLKTMLHGPKTSAREDGGLELSLAKGRSGEGEARGGERGGDQEGAFLGHASVTHGRGLG